MHKLKFGDGVKNLEPHERSMIFSLADKNRIKIYSFTRKWGNGRSASNSIFFDGVQLMGCDADSGSCITNPLILGDFLDKMNGDKTPRKKKAYDKSLDIQFNRVRNMFNKLGE